jgi:predicted Zn-dependent protease
MDEVMGVCLMVREYSTAPGSKYLAWQISVVIALTISGCERPNYGPPQGGEGPGRRQQQLALGPAQELQMGRQAYREILSNPQEFGKPLPASSAEVRRVQQIVNRIIRSVEIDPLMREMNIRKGYRYEWEVNVLDTNKINAFCLPGGKIGVFRGIMQVAENDDQLATVLSHEIGHALAHHSSERLAHGEFNRGVSGKLWAKAFDRQQESEADHIGIFLMAFADYDPQQAVHFWERMESLSQGRQIPEVLSDHPSDARRVHDIQDWVPKARAAKQAYKDGNIAGNQRN